MDLIYGYKILILLALQDVERETRSLRAAAKHYNVGATTLARHRRNPYQMCTMGRPLYFSHLEEDSLEEILLLCSEFQIGMDRDQFLNVVRDCARLKGITRSADVLGRGWFHGFCRRHPKISERVTHAQNVKKIKEWTHDNALRYIALLKSLNDDGYLSDPDGIYNNDESGFKLAVQRSKTLARKGARDIRSLDIGNDRDQITALFCGSASGRILRPMILFEGAKYQAKWFEGLSETVVIGVNASGMMDFESLIGYFEKELVPVALKRDKTVVFFDGHFSHIYNTRLLKICILNKTRLVCLPAGQTARLQPLDMSVFGGLKNYSDHVKKARQFLADPITKESFPRHLAEVVSNAEFSTTLVSGFAKSGIFPFSPDVILGSVFKTPMAPETAVDISGDQVFFHDVSAQLQTEFPQLTQEKAAVFTDSFAKAIAGDKVIRNCVAHWATTVIRSAPRSSSRVGMEPPNKITPFQFPF